MTAAPLASGPRAALIALLRAHVPYDAKEREDRDAIAAFVAREAAPHLRSTRDGHLTGSAFILTHDRSAVLLTHHRKLERWLQLGGHGEGEWDPAAIAAREALEESGLEGLRFHEELCPLDDATGLRRPFDLDIHRIPARKDEPAHDHLDVRYVLLAPPGASPTITAESKALRFFQLEEALSLPIDASLHRALSRLCGLATARV